MTAFLAGNTSPWQPSVAPLTILCSILSTSSSCSVLDSRRKYTSCWLTRILSVSIAPGGNFLMVLTLQGKDTQDLVSFG